MATHVLAFWLGNKGVAVAHASADLFTLPSERQYSVDVSYLVDQRYSRSGDNSAAIPAMLQGSPLVIEGILHQGCYLVTERCNTTWSPNEHAEAAITKRRDDYSTITKTLKSIAPSCIAFDVMKNCANTAVANLTGRNARATARNQVAGNDAGLQAEAREFNTPTSAKVARVMKNVLYDEAIAFMQGGWSTVGHSDNIPSRPIDNGRECAMAMWLALYALSHKDGPAKLSGNEAAIAAAKAAKAAAARSAAERALAAPAGAVAPPAWGAAAAMLPVTPQQPRRQPAQQQRTTTPRGRQQPRSRAAPATRRRLSYDDDDASSEEDEDDEDEDLYDEDNLHDGMTEEEEFVRNGYDGVFKPFSGRSRRLGGGEDDSKAEYVPPKRGAAGGKRGRSQQQRAPRKRARKVVESSSSEEEDEDDDDAEVQLQREVVVAPTTARARAMRERQAAQRAAGGNEYVRQYARR